MRILKRVLLVLVVLVLVVVVAAVIFVKTFDVNRYKPQILRQAKAALGRDVDFEKANLAFSFAHGVRLEVARLTVSEDPVFGTGDALAVGNVSLGVDALGYLFQKKVSISDIVIDAPRVTIIRQKDGSLNVQSLAGAAGGARPAAGPAALASAPLALPVLLISSLKVAGGSVTYVDHSFEPAVTLEISDLSASVSRISLTEPFPFVVEGAVLSAKKNVRLEGKAQFDLKTKEVTLSGLKADTDLSQLLLEKIPVVFPMAQGAVLPVSLEGKASVTAEKLTAGPSGLAGLAADVVVTDGGLRFKELPAPIHDVQASAHITASTVHLEKATAKIAGGAVQAAGVLEDYLTVRKFDMNVDAEGLKIQDLLPADTSAVKVEGLAAGHANVKGQGLSPDALSTSLSGDGKISVAGVRLRDINVLRKVLDKISVLPGLAERVEANLPDRYKEKLTQADTVLSDIELPFQVKNGRLLVPDTVLRADEFLFQGSTEAGLDGTFSLMGSFYIPGELSAAMVAGVPELQYLLDEKQQIYFPLKVSGNAAKMDVNVDKEYIGKKLLENQAKVQLLKVIDKAIGAEGPEAASSGPQGAAETADAAGQGAAVPASDGSQKSSATQELVSSVLGTIFNKQ